MRKSGLINAVAEEFQIPKYASELLIRFIFSYIKDKIVTGASINIPGFGIFRSKKVAGRTISNFFNRGTVNVPERVQPVFKANKKLKEACNQ